MNLLDSLKIFSSIVVDSSQLDSISKYDPVDATTNPSLILAAVANPDHRAVIEGAVCWSKKNEKSKKKQLKGAMEKLFVDFGTAIVKQVPGRVSTEVDARFSFDKAASISQARRLIALYSDAGIDRKRVLIKLAATWEGMEAARKLEKEGIHCNMTLIFSLPQAILSAEAGATLLSPFVGRILDWHKRNFPEKSFNATNDPGVLSVTAIYNYIKKFGYSTQIMGASFRNKEQILALAGSDFLTIAPPLLEQLKEENGELTRHLCPEKAEKIELKKLSFKEKQFHWSLCENRMASEKLYEGIRNFGEDMIRIEQLLLPHFR